MFNRAWFAKTIIFQLMWSVTSFADNLLHDVRVTVSAKWLVKICKIDFHRKKWRCLKKSQNNNRFSIDKRNHQLKFKIWDVNKQFETDPKVMGLNLVISILFFIDNNVTNNICYLLVIYYHCWGKNNPKKTSFNAIFKT